MDIDDFADGDVIWLEFDDGVYTSQWGEVVGIHRDIEEIDVQLASVGHKSGANTEDNFLIDLVTVDLTFEAPAAHGETVNDNTESMGRVTITHQD